MLRPPGGVLLHHGGELSGLGQPCPPVAPGLDLGPARTLIHAVKARAHRTAEGRRICEVSNSFWQGRWALHPWTMTHAQRINCPLHNKDGKSTCQAADATTHARQNAEVNCFPLELQSGWGAAFFPEFLLWSQLKILQSLLANCKCIPRGILENKIFFTRSTNSRVLPAK